MLKKFILSGLLLSVFLLNTICLFAIFLIEKTTYSFRGYSTELLLWQFTFVLNIFCLFLIVSQIIFQLIIKHLKQKYIKLFGLILLNYISCIYPYYILVFALNRPISEHDYISPSGQKSITLSPDYDRDIGCYYNVYVNMFIFDRREKPINLPIGEEIEMRSKFCNDYQKATKITWLDNERQVEIKINIKRTFQIETIKIN